MWNIILFVLALAPILWLIVSLSGLKMPGYQACPLALGISMALALIVWKMNPLDLFTAGLEGVALALWPIVLVIIAAVFTYNLSIHNGNMEFIKRMLTGVTTDRRILVLIIAWGFGGFLEGMAGFGTAVAIPASMLLALGFDPMLAAVVCLLADTVPTAFGSIGIPTTTLAPLIGLDPLKLASATAIQLFPLILIIPFVLVALTGKSIKAIRGIELLTFLSGLSFAVPELLMSLFVGAELPVVVGSVCSMLCTVAGARLLQKRAPAAKTEGKAEPAPDPIPFKRAFVAWLPFILIFVFLVITSNIVPLLHNVLAAIKTSVVIYSGKGASPYTFTWVATPGVLIVLATLIGGAVQGSKFMDMVRVLGRTVKQMTKTIVTIVAVMATAKVMGYSGMISTIAALVVAMTGAFYPLVAPLIGSIGTFITGSATSSSVLFGKLQFEAAHEIGANPYWVSVANTCGATAGKMISPQNIAIAAAATGLAGKDGKMLNSVVKYFIGIIVIMGLITYFCFPLFARYFS